MRLAWPPPWHLIASVLISVIAMALVHLSPPSLQGYLSLLALIFVFFIPGYLATLSLFPGKSDLSGQRRAILCLVSSVFLAGLFSLILTATPRGLQSASLATILSLLAIFLAAVAYGRWSNLPRMRRFLLLPKRGMRSTWALPYIFGAGITGKRAALAIVLLAACFMAFVFGPYNFPFGEPVTKLEVTGQNGNWQDQINFMLTGPASSSGPKALDIQLYNKSDLSNPYEEERLWINQPRNNSSQSGSQSQAMNYTGNNSTVILKDNGKETVLSTGGGSNLVGGTQTADRKPASQKDLQTEKTTSSQPTAASTAVSRVQSDIQVAEKNTSNINVQPSEGNQTGKGNLTFYQADRQEIKHAAKSAPSPIPRYLLPRKYPCHLEQLPRYKLP